MTGNLAVGKVPVPPLTTEPRDAPDRGAVPKPGRFSSTCDDPGADRASEVKALLLAVSGLAARCAATEQEVATIRSKLESLSPPGHAEAKLSSGARIRIPVTVRSIVLAVILTAALALWILRNKLG